MKINYEVINSGSDGNATVIEEVILIDCGVSYKKLQKYIKKLQVIFLTHIHCDHFNKTTIKRLVKERPLLRFACCEWLVELLIDCGVSKKNIDVLEIGKKYDYGIFKIVPIKLYHDVPNCGYKLFLDEKKMIYATDTNTLDGIVSKDYDLYLIEGNYENKEELYGRSDNEFYNSRVINTHLSKEYATKWLLENMNDESEYRFMHEHIERG